MGRRKKNFTIENIHIEDFAAEGKCVARHNEKVVFVQNAAPGDVVDVFVTRDKKSYSEGRATKFHELSDKRSEPFCSHYGVCGGCKWQHIGYDHQLFYKEKQVKEQLTRIGDLKFPEVKPIVGSEKTKYYRNKLEYTFTNWRWFTDQELKEKEGEELNRNGVGFHVPGRFDKVLDVDICHLQEDISNQIRKGVRDLAFEKEMTFFDIKRQYGFLRNLIIRTANTGDLMVILQVFEDKPEWIKTVLEYLKEQFPQITSLQYIINSKGNETFHDLDVICYHGKPYITETMEDLQYRVGPKSFFQTNSSQAYVLYKLTRELAQLTGNEIVYDLYTGTGTIANFVAHQAKKVIGVEYVEQAIEDAKINSQINNIDNTVFYAGDMKDVLTPQFIKENGTPDTLIVDPPRAGMHESVIQTILGTNAKRIVYVSCNPATQARDLKLMDEKYEIKLVQPVDMFPHTHHVENIVLLELR